MADIPVKNELFIEDFLDKSDPVWINVDNIMKNICTYIKSMCEKACYTENIKIKNNVYIFGGFCRDIIDSYYNKKPITFNDIDVFINIDEFTGLELVHPYEYIEDLKEYLKDKKFIVEEFKNEGPSDFSSYSHYTIIVNGISIDINTCSYKHWFDYSNIAFYTMFDFRCNNLVIDCYNNYKIYDRDLMTSTFNEPKEINWFIDVLYLREKYLKNNVIYAKNITIFSEEENFKRISCIFEDIKKKYLFQIHDKIDYYFYRRLEKEKFCSRTESYSSNTEFRKIRNNLCKTEEKEHLNRIKILRKRNEKMIKKSYSNIEM